MAKQGMVYLVGAGPGDPGLFTLKGKKLLEAAEVVIYDRLVSSKILAYAPENAELIYVGKESSNHALPQEEINKLLVSKAREGKRVVRLKGGDPFVFGRGGEEAQFVREHGCDFEIVPGITSAIAVPAYAGIPVTHRDDTSSVTIVTGHEKEDKAESSINWKELGESKNTVVFLMGVENLAYICEQLMKYGRDPATPVALIRWGTLPAQQVLIGELSNIAAKKQQAHFKPPAVIVVGEVVRQRQLLQWVENKPLWGKRIVITRARAQASILADKISDLGGEAIEFPSIQIRPLENLSPLYKALKDIRHYNWLLFTSVNAVDLFFNALRDQDLDIRDLGGIKIAAIGTVTRDKITDRGLKVDVVPEEFVAEGMIKALTGKINSGDWVLLPRAQGARSILPDALKKAGAHVNEVIIYEAVPNHEVRSDILEAIKGGEVDYITFTSSSTVSNFVNIIGWQNVEIINRRSKVACIGPVTAKTANEHGLKTDIIANPYTIDGLVEAILEAVKASQRTGEGQK